MSLFSFIEKKIYKFNCCYLAKFKLVQYVYDPQVKTLQGQDIANNFSHKKFCLIIS